VALGKKLVAELGLGDSGDTLGRWMAQYLAELLHDAETAIGDDRSAKQVLLRDGVLALWAHRFELPDGKRPFGDVEPILRALASLDPESQSSRYFSPSRAPDDESAESQDTRKWIGLAMALDQMSKILIDYCLALAADAALDSSKGWVELAKKAGINNSADFLVIRFITDQADLMKAPNLAAHQRRILTDRKKTLEAVMSAATDLATEIGCRLESLPPVAEDEDDSRLFDFDGDEDL
jgi:hypothetical protein